MSEIVLMLGAEMLEEQILTKIDLELPNQTLDAHN